MAPAMGVVTAVWVAALMSLHHQAIPLIALAAIGAGLAVRMFFHFFGRSRGA
jgi:hypothetical protein